ncbi:SixA phosphatase family protein [Nesterenkonia sphaerica]|uniref:Histidine phosphatase family protein n=1 Tax=Nesterenkonia sphaerica TaxID=1804988 RepID=A0A5R9AAE2_9MICC|nr:histidine phosphatase family protein [Nesterenkonia sphaerica]TLP75749.1 histidine phosphatase family protein [Nesterenkonia sphaerica]
MSKTLLVLRHAEAGHSFSGDDFARTLTESGQAQACQVGRWLLGSSCVPEMTVVSSAMRTRQTSIWISHVLGDQAPTAELDDRIYLGSEAQLCSVLNETPETVSTLLLIAHMPGVQELSMRLTSAESQESAALEMATQWPPAGLARFELSKPWAELDGRDAVLTDFVTAGSAR